MVALDAAIKQRLVTDVAAKLDGQFFGVRGNLFGLPDPLDVDRATERRPRARADRASGEEEGRLLKRLGQDLDDLLSRQFRTVGRGVRRQGRLFCESG